MPAWAENASESSVECGNKKSLEVMAAKDTLSIEMLKESVQRSACDEDSVFSDINDQKFIINHDRLRCEAVNVCLGTIQNAKTFNEASEIIKGNISKAALLGIVAEEVNRNLEYNISLNHFEETNKISVCPDEKIEDKCENDIRKAIASVAGSFSDFPGLDREPLSSEILSEFFAEKFFSKNQFAYKTKSQFKYKYKFKKELSGSCRQKISFNKICQLSKIRLDKISKCEDKNLSGCLDKEQKTLASLLNIHKKNKDFFLSLEKQLCSSTRIVSESASKLSRLSLASTYSTTKKPLSGIKIKDSNQSTGLKANGQKVSGLRAPASEQTDKEITESAGPNSPSKADLVRVEALKVDVAVSRVADSVNESDEIKGFANSDDSSLSDQFSDSFNKITQDDRKESTSNINNSLNSDFSNRFNAITQEEQNKAEAEKKLQELEENSNLSTDDKLKKNEMDALVAQIDSLKAKIEDMNANVDDLKSKKVSVAEDKEKSEKEALEREKSIADLKKQLAELEADKKKKLADSIAKAQLDERSRSVQDAYKMSIPTPAFPNRDNDTTNAIKRERDHEVSSNALNQVSGSFAESRTSANLGTSQISQASGSSRLVLRSEGFKATADSSVVYMTDGELQKYPYHLNNDASSTDIEKMIIGNNGASIILGNTEQIIPITENGLVMLDENGKIKYKRIKISIVKNENERKQNIAREISSVADLQRAEQRKRDLIRYQEMKDAFRKATDKK